MWSLSLSLSPSRSHFVILLSYILVLYCYPCKWLWWLGRASKKLHTTRHQLIDFVCLFVLFLFFSSFLNVKQKIRARKKTKTPIKHVHLCLHSRRKGVGNGGIGRDGFASIWFCSPSHTHTHTRTYAVLETMPWLAKKNPSLGALDPDIKTWIRMTFLRLFFYPSSIALLLISGVMM